jgi:hypothetical protein
MKNFTAIKIDGKKRTFQRNTFSAKQYFLEPCKSGLFGFAIFITILIIVKLFSYTIGSYDYFSLEISDVQLSLVGFVLLFLIRFLENFKEQDNN